ncbi:MAG: ABC transporter permease [Thermoprotei archaeon]
MEDLLGIITRSAWISGTATLLASTWSIVIAYYSTRSHILKSLLIPVFEALIGIPTVLVGLLVYMLVCVKCPLGFTGLLYTPYAIMLGQAILITPLITAVVYRVFEETSKTYGELVLSLGGSEKQVFATVIYQSLPGVIAGIVMGFSRAIGELGIALLVGGNIRGYTRVVSTAIALMVSQGDLEGAMMLGLVLVLLTIGVSLAIRSFRRIYEW